ncbi:MAG: hypothetical protein NXI10_14230 [bacterium]|nr:hypothetical protein [bacterium]
MKAYLLNIGLLVVLALSCSATYAQCDPSLGEYAIPGSYEVHFNPEKTDNRVAPQQLANCQHLLQIESARQENRDVVLEIENYIIVVTSRKRLSEVELENQSK